MSRDKYSDDHTISVSKGDGTLTVEGNFTFTGQLGLTTIPLSDDVYQRMRFSGAAFHPTNYSATAISYNIGTGRLTFDSTQEVVLAAIPAFPQGATLRAIRFVGAAVGSADVVTVKLQESDGDSSTTLATVAASEEGFNVDKQANLTSGPKQVDYTENKAYFLSVTGEAGTVSASIDYVDIIYSIDRLPLDSEDSLP